MAPKEPPLVLGPGPTSGSAPAEGPGLGLLFMQSLFSKLQQEKKHDLIMGKEWGWD